jgi:predicted dinucleotide-binding enzyme
VVAINFINYLNKEKTKMSFRVLATMNIAIIGNSEVGIEYAKDFSAADQRIFMAWENMEKRTVRHKLEMFGSIEICSIEEAADQADFIILATQPKDAREAAYWLGDIRNKVIIDATANVITPEKDEINTLNAIKSITGSANAVKVFRTFGYEKIVSSLFDHGTTEMLMVGDSKKAKEVFKIMSAAIGINEFYDFGDAGKLPLFNQMTSVMRRLKETERQTKPNKYKLVKKV